MPAEQGIDWKQTLTVAFKDPAIQERVLLFEDRNALKQLVDNQDADAYRGLWQQAGTRRHQPGYAARFTGLPP